MNPTLSRWLDRNRATRELRRQTARCLRGEFEQTVAPWLFAGDVADDTKAWEAGKKRLKEFIDFVEKNHQQARRLRDLVARVPNDTERWSEFITHELGRDVSDWKSAECAAKALAFGFTSDSAGELILKDVYSADHEQQCRATEWKRRVFLTFVDAIIAKAAAEKGE